MGKRRTGGIKLKLVNIQAKINVHAGKLELEWINVQAKVSDRQKFGAQICT